MRLLARLTDPDAMPTIDLPTLQTFLQTNWGWAAGLAGSMLALTLAAGALLRQERKDEIALWLMGAETEENWSRYLVGRRVDGLEIFFAERRCRVHAEPRFQQNASVAERPPLAIATPAIGFPANPGRIPGLAGQRSETIRTRSPR